MSAHRIAVSAALTTLALSLGLSGCGSANTDTQGTENTSTTESAPSSIEARVARVYIPDITASWVIIGVQESGSTTITARYCMGEMCFLLQPDDQITYKLDGSGHMAQVTFTS